MGDTKSRAVQIRLPEEEVQALDAWVEEIRAEHPGMSSVTRSDLIRDLVMKATRERREAAKKGGKR